MQVGVGPTQRISRRNSTDNASWGGPNTEADGKSANKNVQVGVGPRHREFQEEILQTMQVGVGQR
ncbi:hypothetical protein LHK29_10795 [Staphylococcus argenteus]|nr:hypothetical protein [Staphylococcus argenteus]